MALHHHMYHHLVVRSVHFTAEVNFFDNQETLSFWRSACLQSRVALSNLVVECHNLRACGCNIYSEDFVSTLLYSSCSKDFLITSRESAVEVLSFLFGKAIANPTLKDSMKMRLNLRVGYNGTVANLKRCYDSLTKLVVFGG